MAECETELDQLHEQIEAKRAAAEPIHRKVREDIAARREPAPESVVPEVDRSEREKVTAALEAQREKAMRLSAWNTLLSRRGRERYSDCRLKNFACGSVEQRAAVVSLTEYCRAIEERIKDGDGIILFGPRGTGKDHLAMAVCRVAVFMGFSVVWQNGMDLCGDIRDAIGSGDSERSLVWNLSRADVLYLSDPVPPVGVLTEFQAAMLFRILDARYSRRKPTICTVNVASGDELDKRIGPQNGDRLRDGSLAIYCNWPSYRKVKD